MYDLPALRLEGRSGCRLEVRAVEGTFVVRKYSKESNYNDRLLLQAVKQRDFQSDNPIFKVPAIIDMSSAAELATWFDMEYVHGQKYSEYLERLTVSEIKKMADTFYAYFLAGLNTSKKEVPDRALFLRKIESLEGALMERGDLDAALVIHSMAYLREVPNAEIPLGKCHGDFTFSNMLFSGEHIYLVDFLDSFIESPLIDLVKFRQDTFFHWTLFIDNNFPSGRMVKIIQIFEYLDREIFTRLVVMPEVKGWYFYLQVFNLVRILPYVNKPAEIAFVQNAIKKLFNSAN